MTLYLIEVRGHLDTRWEKLFTGFSIKHAINSEGQAITRMTGEIADQAALFGIINRLRNLGIELISV